MLCVLAVLIGLFGMHGLATAQGGGCHAIDGMIKAPSMVTAPMTAEPVGATASTHGMASVTAGDSCLFVLPAGWSMLAWVLLAALITVVLAAGDRRWPGHHTGRSPPTTGVSLLYRVCVSRT